MLLNDRVVNFVILGVRHVVAIEYKHRAQHPYRRFYNTAGSAPLHYCFLSATCRGSPDSKRPSPYHYYSACRLLLPEREREFSSPGADPLRWGEHIGFRWTTKSYGGIGTLCSGWTIMVRYARSMHVAVAGRLHAQSQAAPRQREGLDRIRSAVDHALMSPDSSNRARKQFGRQCIGSCARRQKVSWRICSELAGLR